jgi:SAM-dependent methyltransferase
MTEFDQLRATWTQLGEVDPLWAILSDPAKEGGRWDVAQFFRSGELDLDGSLRHLDALGVKVTPGPALDFGCGVGRVTQAMSRRFAHSHGVDVAESMIDQANRFNRAPDRCTYHHNPQPDLGLFPDATFDFVYSMIVLQHMAPELAKGYVREFLRVVKPGGVVVFQLPAERALVPLRHGQTRCDASLRDSDFRAAIDVVTPGWRVRRMRAGTEKRITVRVHNRSDTTWRSVGTPDGKLWIQVANQWYRPDGTVVRQDDGRARLPVDLRPGESAKVRLTVTPPDEPGDYLLVLDVVQEAVCWFGERGSPTTDVPVEVTAGHGKAHVEAGGEEKPAFEMHSVPRTEVEAEIATAGGRVLAVLPDESAGDAWISWLYVATAAEEPAGAQE